MTQYNLTLSVAESCTGGLLSSLIVELPGSSSWYKGGVISYCNEAKQNLLFVDPELLIKFGAVSGEAVEAMSCGALKRFNTDISMAISGVAGPTGGTDLKPVGLVWISTQSETVRQVKSYQIDGPRNIVRQMACEKALNQMCRLLKIE